MKTLNLDKPWAWCWLAVALIFKLYLAWNIPLLLVFLPFLVVPSFFLLFVGAMFAIFITAIIVAAVNQSTFNSKQALK